MPFELKKLPYEANALEPVISERTMNFHYGKHHKSYVDKLNKALENSGAGDFKGNSLEEIIFKTYNDTHSKNIFNNAAQVWNHDFFWRSMTPKGGGEPKGLVADLIKRDFGGYDAFAEAFKDEATGQFGSGWAWLVISENVLRVMSTPNAEPPFVNGYFCLLTLDVWEHAYYLDYQNARGAFVDAFLENLVNWAFVEEQLELSAPEGVKTARQAAR